MIPFPQITIKDNIGDRNIEIIFSSFLNKSSGKNDVECRLEKIYLN